jgi:hypothetical protein
MTVRLCVGRTNGRSHSFVLDFLVLLHQGKRTLRNFKAKRKKSTLFINLPQEIKTFLNLIQKAIPSQSKKVLILILPK